MHSYALGVARQQAGSNVSQVTTTAKKQITFEARKDQITKRYLGFKIPETGSQNVVVAAIAMGMETDHKPNNDATVQPKRLSASAKEKGGSPFPGPFLPFLIRPFCWLHAERIETVAISANHGQEIKKVHLECDLSEDRIAEGVHANLAINVEGHQDDLRGRER